jgi:multidrug transporter EmrE-like cation transporter
MADDYIIGVVFAILAGTIASSGNILQKNAVNKIPKEKRDEKFMRTLVKSPSWVIGTIMCYVISAVFMLLAQNSIGPALIPGLFASGLIVLAIGSVKLIGERLKTVEFFAVILIVIAVLILGLSELDISADEIGTIDLFLMIRIIIFSIIILILWIFNTILSKKDIKHKGIVLSIAAGYQFILSNVWTFCLLISINSISRGSALSLDIMMLCLALIIIILNNYLGIKQTQEAYKYAQASQVQPTQEVPKQISTVFIYFFVFLKMASGISISFIITGSILVIVGGFLLGKRQAELDTID